jgi:hypothetical protein
VAVPLVLLILSRVFVHMAGEFPADPDYSYLMNGLEVLTFYPPSYISHPGTSLIMLTTLVNLVTWLVTLPFHRQGLFTDVLSKPEIYLTAINAVLVLGIAAAAFWFALRIRRASGSVAAALTGQVSQLLSFPAMIALNRVAPEPLLLASTLVLAGLLTPLAFGKGESLRWIAAAVGIVLGFSIATKITALPLLPSLLLLPDWALRKRAGWFALAALVFFTLPAAHHYPLMLWWFTGMATHSGSYMAGPAGLPPLATLISDAVLLFQQAPELFIALLAYMVVALFGPRPLRRLMVVSALVVAAQILMVVKQPSTRYLVPAVAMMALANAAIAAHILSRRVFPAIAAALVAMVAGFCHNFLTTAAWAQDNRAVYRANQNLMQSISGSGCAVVPYYEAPLMLYDLDFGNQYAGSRFGRDLQRLYPRAFTYDWARQSFMFFGTNISLAEFQARLAPAKCIYLVGSPLERFNGTFGLPMSALTFVARSRVADEGQALAVYRYQP